MKYTSKDITVKTTSFLVDEMITCEFKAKVGNEEARHRRHKLGNIVMSRLGERALDPEFNRAFWNLEKKLRAVLKDCWDAQEVVGKYWGRNEAELSLDETYELACAGLEAQRTNKERSILMREMDLLLEELPTLEKSYGNSFDRSDV